MYLKHFMKRKTFLMAEV